MSNGIMGIDQAYSTINTMVKDTKLEYIEITNDTINLIPIGVFCNDEIPETTISLEKNEDIVQYWTTPDYLNTCLENSAKIIDNLSFEEESKMRNGAIQSIPGVFVATLNSPVYAIGNTNLFLNNSKAITTINPDFNNTKIDANTAVELFFYFKPNVSGNWTFTIPSYIKNKLYSKLWVGNDFALYDYTNENSDICNDQNMDGNTGKSPVTNTFTLKNVIAGSFIPVRVHIIATAAYYGSNTMIFFTATSPSTNEIIGSNNDTYNYFVTLSMDGVKPYLKHSTYFSIVEDPKDKNKYSCWFLKSEPNQYNKLQNLKLNSKIQYIRSTIPTPLTTIIRGTVVSPENSPINIDAPIGVQLDTKAVYGQPNYNQTIIQTQEIKIPKNYGPQNTSVQLSTNDKFNGSTANIQTNAYNTTETVTRQTYTNKIVPQSKDVTAQIQSQVNQNNLTLKSNDYTNLPNPATFGNRANNTLTIAYSYVPDQSQYKNKKIYLDKTGQIMINYDYGGKMNTEPINIPNPPPKWNDQSQPCPYVLCLDNKSNPNGIRLSVMNNNTLIGFLELLNVGKSGKMPYSIPNTRWLQNPNNKTSLPINNYISQSNNSLISADGKFKLVIENTQISVIYGIKPYNTTNQKYSINYTTKENVDNNNKQMYYFYRIRTRGLAGKKFLMETNTPNSIKNIHYVPNNSNYILGFSDWLDGNNMYIATPQDYNLKNYTETQTTNINGCKASCAVNTKCDHGFFMKNKSGVNGTCYLDETNNSNPLISTTNPDIQAYKDGAIFKKKYKIINSCVNENNKSMYKNSIGYKFSEKDIQNYNIDYSEVPNRPEMTYYCGLPWYTKNTTDIDNIYKKQGFATMSTNPHVEPFDTNCSSQSCFDKNIQELAPIMNYYSKTQDQISETHNKTRQNLKSNVDLSNNLADPLYKYGGGDADIPYIFTNNIDPKPATTILDGQLIDMKQNSLIHNTIFTLASITTVSVLFIALFVIKD
jgi:hypothetical protein